MILCRFTLKKEFTPLISSETGVNFGADIKNYARKGALNTTRTTDKSHLPVNKIHRNSYWKTIYFSAYHEETVNILESSMCTKANTR